MSLLYLDASAIVKLVVREPGSDDVVRAVAGRQTITSAVAGVEVRRAVRRAAPRSEERAIRVLERIAMLAVDPPVIERAAGLEPSSLRSLDAIHLASALSLGDDLDALLTSDDRLAAAARAAGIEVR